MDFECRFGHGCWSRVRVDYDGGGLVSARVAGNGQTCKNKVKRKTSKSQQTIINKTKGNKLKSN
jgi:hypothetical protein